MAAAPGTEGRKVPAFVPGNRDATPIPIKNRASNTKIRHTSLDEKQADDDFYPSDACRHNVAIIIKRIEGGNGKSEF